MTVALPRWVRGLSILLLCMFLGSSIQAQERVITGKITDSKEGTPIIGATVTVKGTTIATSTEPDGTFRLGGVPADAKTLVITSVGFATREVAITGSEISVALTSSDAALSEVVVVGYGTARKKDLTGSVAQVKEKDFNQGIINAPDQLIQGKVAGVQVLNNSGQPGGQTSVRIRGNSSVRAGGQPLYVVDGVPLDGRSARPGLDARGLGASPDANPLNFLNPADIASMDVLKDASATAIYGSRGANGVVLITTKRGKSGAPKIDVGTQVGFSEILKKLEVLSASEYRDALSTYNISGSDWGGNVDAMDAITRKGLFQNYNVSASGGNENARLRLSMGYYDQEGIIIKSGMKKYTANLNGNFKFLESKKLGLDINVITSQVVEDIAPVATNSGFEGSLIGQALQWNPTRPLRNPDGSLNIKGGGFPNANINPLAASEAYSDNSKTTNVLASVSPYFKFNDHLEYRMLMSLNYGTGVRRTEIARWINIPGVENLGWGNVQNNELTTQQITHTLNYNKQLTDALYFSGTLGYEYIKFQNKGFGAGAEGFTSSAIPYTNYLQGSNQANRGIGSFADPSSELQSFFGRVNVNWLDKYLLTATFRADGSNKFGSNNRYGYFPSLAAAWNISNEEFMKGSTFFDNLKLRVGWGVVGNQEFPAGAAQDRYAYTGANGAFALINVANPDLRWERSETFNFGLDYSVMKGRLSGSVEYFIKNTTDLLFNFEAKPPAPASRYWVNLPGEVINSGLEFTLNWAAIEKKDFQWNVGIFASFLKNELKNYDGPAVLTGAINGQGLTGAFAQRMANGQPLNAFFMGRFLGIDRDGAAQFEGGDPNNNANRFFVGNPNPTTLLGFSTTLAYKKLSLNMNMNGAFGHDIYNNTTQATLAIGNLNNNRNIAKTVFNTNLLESTANSQPVSTRYLEKGDYFKMANMTLSYFIGDIGKNFKGVNVYLTGQNLFILTNYSGFDPEVNTPKPVDGVPSFGIEYTPYPSARTYMIGLSVSL